MRLAAGTLMAISLACALASPAAASEKRTAVTASVPEVCRFSASPLVVQDDGQVALGQAFEACNSRRSFSISANTRVLGAGERLTLGYGIDRLALEEDGSTTLFQRHGPTFKMVDLSLEASVLQAPVSLTFSMSAV